MAGFSNDVMYANNVRFDGAKQPGQVTTDGQLLIGSTAAPNIRVGTLTSAGGTITITPGAGTINLETAGGGIAIDSIGVDTTSGTGVDPVVPTAGGLVTFTGAQIAAAAVANCININSNAPNQLEIQVQRSSAQAVSTLSANGVCHFNSAQFTVGIDGFVSSLSGTAPWLDIAGGALAAFTGYYVTAAAVVTLPAAPAQGTIIEIIDEIGGGVVVTSAGADLIRISNTVSSAPGTATSTQRGDALRLVYRTASASWICCPGAAGNWILA
jgi:hypothetical protein